MHACILLGDLSDHATISCKMAHHSTITYTYIVPVLSGTGVTVVYREHDLLKWPCFVLVHGLHLPMQLAAMYMYVFILKIWDNLEIEWAHASVSRDWR